MPTTVGATDDDSVGDDDDDGDDDEVVSNDGRPLGSVGDGSPVCDVAALGAQDVLVLSVSVAASVLPPESVSDESGADWVPLGSPASGVVVVSVPAGVEEVEVSP